MGLMLMLHLNVTINQLAMTSSVSWYSNVLRVVGGERVVMS